MFLTYSQLKTLNCFPQKRRNTFLILTRIHKGSPHARNLRFSYWNSLACHLKGHAIGSGLSCHSWDVFFPCCLPCLCGLTFPTETSTQTHSQTTAFLSLALQGKSHSVLTHSHFRIKIAACLVLICGPLSLLARGEAVQRVTTGLSLST